MRFMNSDRKVKSLTRYNLLKATARCSRSSNIATAVSASKITLLTDYQEVHKRRVLLTSDVISDFVPMLETVKKTFAPPAVSVVDGLEGAICASHSNCTWPLWIDSPLFLLGWLRFGVAAAAAGNAIVVMTTKLHLPRGLARMNLWWL